jgi:hypothetical protein
MTPQKFKDETLRTLADTTESIARLQPTVMGADLWRPGLRLSPRTR